MTPAHILSLDPCLGGVTDYLLNQGIISQHLANSILKHEEMPNELLTLLNNSTDLDITALDIFNTNSPADAIWLLGRTLSEAEKYLAIIDFLDITAQYSNIPNKEYYSILRPHVLTLAKGDYTPLLLLKNLYRPNQRYRELCNTYTRDRYLPYAYSLAHEHQPHLAIDMALDMAKRSKI